MHRKHGQHGSYRGSLGRKTEKTDFLPKQIFCSIWRFRPFWRDRMERKHILRRNRHRVSNFSVSPNSGIFKIHDFWKIDVIHGSIFHGFPMDFPFFGHFPKWIFDEGRSTRSPWCLEKVQGPTWRSKDHLVMKGLSKNVKNHEF